MSDIRPELSKKNKYYISRHRYYELYHFCRQYEEYKKLIQELQLYSNNSINEKVSSSELSDNTYNLAIQLQKLTDNINLIEYVAKLTDQCLAPYIITCVTDGLTFDKLNALYNIPCCRDTFYDRYRKFFYILSQKK